jgi:intracellular multiplication protein IcmJ
VLNVDGNYRNNKLENLISACPMCAQCHFLDGVGLPSFPGGVLVYAPEITQAEMNSMAHVLFQSIFSEDESASQSKNIYRTIRLRSQLVEKQLGDDLSNPSTYARMLIDADQKQAEIFNNKVSQSVRLLPDMIGFQPLIRGWQAAALKELSSRNH